MSITLEQPVELNRVKVLRILILVAKSGEFLENWTKVDVQSVFEKSKFSKHQLFSNLSW